MKKKVACICTIMLSCSTTAFAWFGVQLPFIDGQYYECTQNSFDTPTHRGDYTKYDVDFDLPSGTLIVAAHGGEVIATKYNCIENDISCGDKFGNYIKIKHDDNHATVYTHLLENGVLVNEGDWVEAGQPIGYSGNTGNSEGEHLHFGMHDTSTDTKIIIGLSIAGMEVLGYDRDSKKTDWWRVGVDRGDDKAFHCQLSMKNGDSKNASGHEYEAKDINGFIKSAFQCAKLSNGNVHCWRGDQDDTGRFHSAECSDSRHHLEYYHDNTGYHSRSLSEDDGQDMCDEHTGSINILTYLTGGHPIGGGGTSTQPIDPPAPGKLPDFITSKVTMGNESGSKEKYTWKINETAYVHSWTDNIGTADWEGKAKKIKVSFYLSKGTKEDPHSEWVRVGERQEIKKDNLDVKDKPKHEKIVFNIPQWAAAGYIYPGKTYNFVVCADRPKDQDNGDGDVKEKHKSNNCSTEAVFYVDSIEPPTMPDLTSHSLQLNSGSATLTGGSLYGLTVNVRNAGNGSADSGFQIKYEIKGPSTGGLWKTVGEKSFTAVPFAAGADQQISTNDSFAAAPTVEGDYLLRACADSTQAVTESNEGNNCSGELAVYVGAPPNPSLKPVYRFRDYAHSSYFYTASEDEKNLVIDKYSYLWTYQHIEHCAFPAKESGSVPVHRFRADIPAGTFYFYTASEAEKDMVVSKYPDLWKYQGVVWYAYDHEDSSMNTVPVHRFRADTASAVFYFYTASEAEKDYVIASYPDLWKYQGIAWYGFRCP